jgi:hypothetical protein
MHEARPRDERAVLSIVVRLLERTSSPDRLTGEVEVVRTGERHRFRDSDELLELLDRLRTGQATSS